MIKQTKRCACGSKLLAGTIFEKRGVCNKCDPLPIKQPKVDPRVETAKVLMDRVENVKNYLDSKGRETIEFILDGLKYAYNVNYLVAKHGLLLGVDARLDKQVAVRAYLDDPGNF